MKTFFRKSFFWGGRGGGVWGDSHISYLFLFLLLEDMKKTFDSRKILSEIFFQTYNKMQMCLRKSLVNYAKAESNIHAYWNSLSFFLLSRKSTKELYSLKSSTLHGIEKNKTELYNF